MSGPRLRALGAACCLGLALALGCGQPGGGGSPLEARLGEAARLPPSERTHRLLQALVEDSRAQGLEAGPLRRALAQRLRVERALGPATRAQRTLWELRSLGGADLPLLRAAAELALVTGRDLERAYRELLPAGTTPEDQALLARLGLRLGYPAPDPPPPAGPGLHARLYAAEAAPSAAAALQLLGRPSQTPGTPWPTPLYAELSALLLDDGRLSEFDAHHAAWPLSKDQRRRLEARRAWQASQPDGGRGEEFRRLRRAPARAPGLALDRLVAARQGLLPRGKRRAIPGASIGQLVDRDPISPRYQADGHPRVLVCVWQGLSPRYLEASLEAGHFPFLRALRRDGAWLRLPITRSPQPPDPSVDLDQLVVAGPRPEYSLEGEPQPWRSPPRRLPQALTDEGLALRQQRLFPAGVPDPAPEQVLAATLDLDLEAGRRLHAVALGREELRPGLAWVDLPDLRGLQAHLLPLQADCAPHPDSLAGVLAAGVPGFDGVFDRVLARLDHLLARQAPLLDRDDHVLVASARGQEGEGGFLLGWGPAFRPGLVEAADWDLKALGELARWLAGGRRGPAPVGAEAWLVRSLEGPFAP